MATDRLTSGPVHFTSQERQQPLCDFFEAFRKNLNHTPEADLLSGLRLLTACTIKSFKSVEGIVLERLLIFWFFTCDLSVFQMDVEELFGAFENSITKAPKRPREEGDDTTKSSTESKRPR